MRSTDTSFDLLLDIISGSNNRPQRLGLTYFSPEQREQFADRHSATTRFIGSDFESATAEVSFFLAVRILWSLVPAKLFTVIAPNFEAMARLSLRKVEYCTGQTERRLATVFRRLRASQLSGRPNTRLDLETRRHKTVFDSQGRRCGLCSYKFESPDFVYALEDDDEVYVSPHDAKPDEVVLPKYYRRPVLDHIIPYFLGGDQPDNWQILCQTCNTGKGESLSWLARKGWAPSSRVGDLFSLTASLRYAVLADFRAKVHLRCANSELRIFRRDRSRLVFYDNLVCQLCE